VLTDGGGTSIDDGGGSSSTDVSSTSVRGMA
jgi:hypothetical protein